MRIYQHGKPRPATGGFPYPGHGTMADIMASEDRRCRILCEHRARNDDCEPCLAEEECPYDCRQRAIELVAKDN